MLPIETQMSGQKQTTHRPRNFDNVKDRRTYKRRNVAYRDVSEWPKTDDPPTVRSRERDWK